jgi:hypothetical protein
LLDQCRKQAMCTALREAEALSNLTERHRSRPIGEQLDNPQASFCWYVRHLRCPLLREVVLE